MREQPTVRPDARRIIDTIVEAMRKGTEPFDDEFSLVPSEFDVEVHPEAYNELESIFPILEERAIVRLDRELEAMNTTGGRNVLRRLAAWLKRIVTLAWVRKAADASTKRLPAARHKPAGYSWRIRFNMTLDPRADLGYIAVIAQLAAPRRDNLAGPKTHRLTVRSADGSFKTRLLGQGERLTPPSETPVAQTTPPEASPAEAAATARTAIAPSSEPTLPEMSERPLARLSYKDDDGQHTFSMNQMEIAVGRGGDEGQQVDLLLHTLSDVSREHLRLRYQPTRQTFLLKDLSSYGTTIDGRPVPPSIDKTTRQDLDHWEPIPPETTIGLAGVLFIDFKSLV